MYISQARGEKELIERFRQIMGVGTVKQRTDRPDVWVWQCTDTAGCARAAEIMWPYLGPHKKNQYDRVRSN